MAEEPFGWIFVNSIPLLYEKKRVAKQFQIETWLDLAQVIKELGIEKPNENGNGNGNNTKPALNYIT